jgi:hypothetical protein
MGAQVAPRSLYLLSHLLGAARFSPLINSVSQQFRDSGTVGGIRRKAPAHK